MLNTCKSNVVLGRRNKNLRQRMQKAFLIERESKGLGDSVTAGSSDPT